MSFLGFVDQSPGNERLKSLGEAVPNGQEMPSRESGLFTVCLRAISQAFHCFPSSAFHLTASPEAPVVAALGR